MPEKRLLLKILIVIILVVLGAVGYVVLRRGIIVPAPSPYDKVFQSQPQPVTVGPVIDEMVKGEKTIEPSGGTIKMKRGGQTITLEIPDGSLFSPEDVTVQAIKSINNLPEGARFIAGAKLEPDGLGLVKPATLTIQLPSSSVQDNLVAFAYERDGTSFHFLPSFGDGNVIEIPMTGFSGGGVIDIPGLIPIINPGTPEQTAKQLLADVLRRAGRKQQRELKRGEEKDIDPRLLQEARGILNTWYRVGVKADLKVAEKTMPGLMGR